MSLKGKKRKKINRIDLKFYLKKNLDNKTKKNKQNRTN